MPRRRSERIAGGEAIRVPGAFDRHVDTETVALLAQERRNVDGRRVEHGGDLERLGARPSRRVRLRDVDRGGAGRAGAERGESADRPGPRHEHPVAGADAGTFDAVRRDCRRLDERALPVRHPRGEPDDLILGDGRELRHPAPGVGEPDAAHRRAQMLQPALAIGAVTAVRERHDRDAISLADACHARTDGHDVARELVPEDLRVLRSGQRVRLDGCHDRAGDVLVQVGAADAAGDDPDDDLARARRGRLGDLLDPEVVRCVEAKCPHRLLPAARHGTIRSARRRAKSSVNEDSVSRTPRKPSRRLCPMSVNVSIVRPRSASVCHHEARLSTPRSRRP